MEKIMAKKSSGKQNGKISQVIGAVVDVEFEFDVVIEFLFISLNLLLI